MQTTNKSNSNTSTTCSTPPPHDLYTIIIAEEKRYIQKGYGLIFASGMAIAFYFFAPMLGQWAWPQLLDYMQANNIPEWKAFLYMSWAMHISMVIGPNLVMWFIYHIEHPFFERYKINHDPWPWNKDRAEWNKLLWKSIKLVSFNVLVVYPIVALLSLANDNW